MSKLQYNLPKDVNKQIEKLCEITGIPSNLIVSAGQIELDAISAMILYRHLDSNERREAMSMIRRVKSPKLLNKIIEITLDTTFVNPQWGLFSLTNKELTKDIAFHNSLDNFMSSIGLGASLIGGKDLFKDIWKSKSVNNKHWILIIIWGCVVFNKKELNKAKLELENRQTLNKSVHFND